jgi:hypothetical protein
MGLFKSLLKPSAGLTALEKTIFDAVRGKLQSPQADLWDAQIKAVNKVYRSPDGMEVNLYAMRNRKSDFPRELCFAQTDEFKIAVVDISANEGKQKLRARVWCVNGHVFSIEYRTSFKEFEQATQGNWHVNCHIENYPT